MAKRPPEPRPKIGKKIVEPQPISSQVVERWPVTERVQASGEEGRERDPKEQAQQALTDWLQYHPHFGAAEGRRRLKAIQEALPQLTRTELMDVLDKKEDLTQMVLMDPEELVPVWDSFDQLDQQLNGLVEEEFALQRPLAERPAAVGRALYQIYGAANMGDTHGAFGPLLEHLTDLAPVEIARIQAMQRSIAAQPGAGTPLWERDALKFMALSVPEEAGELDEPEMSDAAPTVFHPSPRKLDEATTTGMAHPVERLEVGAAQIQTALADLAVALGNHDPKNFVEPVRNLLHYRNYIDERLMLPQLRKLNTQLQQFVSERFGPHQPGRAAQPFEAHARRAAADLEQLLQILEPQLPAVPERKTAVQQLTETIAGVLRRLFGGR